MKPVKVAGETRTFGAPVNWDPETMGECGVLSIKDERINGAAIMTSWWEPDADDIRALISGGRVALRIYGSQHPVVSVYVQDRPDLIEVMEKAKHD